MATGSSADELLTRFETACSLGAESAKVLSLSTDEAQSLLKIFGESVHKGEAPDASVSKSMSLLEKVASGKKVVLYDRTKMPKGGQKAQPLVSSTLVQHPLNPLNICLVFFRILNFVYHGYIPM